MTLAQAHARIAELESLTRSVKACAADRLAVITHLLTQRGTPDPLPQDAPMAEGVVLH